MKRLFLITLTILMLVGCSPNDSTAPPSTTPNSSASTPKARPSGTPDLRNGENLTLEEINAVGNRVSVEAEKRKLSHRDGAILLQKELEKAAVEKVKRTGSNTWP